MSIISFYRRVVGGPDVRIAVSEDNPLPMRLTGTFSVDPPAGGATEAKQDVGNTSLDSIDGKLPSLTLTGARLQVAAGFPEVGSVSIIAVQTAETGTNYSAFASTVCTALDIVNNSGTTIEYRRGGAGETIRIPNGAARLVLGITNANQIDVRRVDVSNTQVTVRAEAFA